MLNELNLNNFSEPFINIDCKKISTQTNLNQLSLQCADYYNEEDLLKLTNLTSLNLRCNIPPANGKTLNFLKQFPKLKDLIIQVLLYSGYSNVDALQNIETLKHLKVIGYDAEEDLKFQNHDWLTIDFINKIKTLEKITLEDCYLSDEKDIQERLNKIKEVEIKK